MSSSEEIFPPSTSLLQKEQITRKVTELGNQFKVFKQRVQAVGIGGQRGHGMGGRGKRHNIVVGGPINDYSLNTSEDGSYVRATDVRTNDNSSYQENT